MAYTIPTQPTNGFTQGSYIPPNPPMDSFSNPIYTSPEPTWTTPSSMYNPISSTSGISGTGYMSSHSSTSPAVQPTIPQHVTSMLPQSHYPPVSLQTMNDSRTKRPRDTTQGETVDDEQDQDVDNKEGQKKPGACARCKGLKVKCEFRSDPDVCNRCLTGNHVCYFLGRKKRKTPPKREDLINQIQAQHKQIKELVAQLESYGPDVRRRRLSGASSDYVASSSGLHSPIPSSSPTGDAYSPTDYESPNKAIEEWIAKAKQSLQEFDVFIAAGPPTNYINDSLHDDSDEGYEDDFSANGEEVTIAIQNTDGQEISENGVSGVKHKTSSSSLTTNGTGVARSRKTKPANLPEPEAPFGLFSQLSIQTVNPPETGEPEEDEDKPNGIAGKNYFRPAPAPSANPRAIRHAPPILTRKVITLQEAEKLFDIYFNNINISVSLLDPVLYTPQKTCYRSPFLFTVICAIASRFYSERPDLYPQLMQYAQQAAGHALTTGAKNVEMVSAFIILSLYPVPAKKWEDQRGWLYLGLAIRTATDLNLNLPNTAKPLNENHAREMLNRTRVWLNCFNLDRSTGSQYGKQPIITLNDYMGNNSEDWWKSSPYNMKNFDIHICAYNAELRVMGRFVSRIYGNPNNPTGLNKDADFEQIATETDEELKQLEKKWAAVLKEADVTDPQGSFRNGLLRLAYPYARLVALSFGFQHAFGKNYTHENPFLQRCLEAAFAVLEPVVDDLCRPSQRIYLRHGPEAQSVFITFAAAFLVKLLQPKFTSYISLKTRQKIRDLVQKVVDLLGSKEIANDDRSGPKLYSKFLRNLLAAPMARIDPTSPVAPARKAKRSVTSPEKVVIEPPPIDTNMTTFRSPARSGGSLSPPARPAAMDFNNFAPAGGVDPYAHDFGISNSLGIYVDNNADEGSTMITDLFNPPLPNDDVLLQSMQLFAGDASWNDPSASQPNAELSWEALSRSMGMDFTQDPLVYNQYMTSS